MGFVCWTTRDDITGVYCRTDWVQTTWLYLLQLNSHILGLSRASDTHSSKETAKGWVLWGGIRREGDMFVQFNFVVDFWLDWLGWVDVNYWVEVLGGCWRWEGKVDWMVWDWKCV